MVHPSRTPTLVTSYKEEMCRWALHWLGLHRKTHLCKARCERSVFAPEMPQEGMTQWYGCSMEKIHRSWLCHTWAKSKWTTSAESKEQDQIHLKQQVWSLFLLFISVLHSIPSGALNFPDAPQGAWGNKCSEVMPWELQQGPAQPAGSDAPHAVAFHQQVSFRWFWERIQDLFHRQYFLSSSVNMEWFELTMQILLVVLCRETISILKSGPGLSTAGGG